MREREGHPSKENGLGPGGDREMTQPVHMPEEHGEWQEMRPGRQAGHEGACIPSQGL